MEYVRQTETEMMNDLKNEACHAIEKLDGNYEWFLKKRANALTSYLIANIEHHPAILQQKESLQRFFENLLPVANPGEVMITDSNSKDYLLGISRRITRDRAPMCAAASNALKTLISGYISDKGPTTSIFDMLFYAGIYEHQDDISYFGIGDFEMGIYYRLLQPREKSRDAMLLSVVSWRLHELQRDQIEDYCLHELPVRGDLKIAAYCRSGEDLFRAPNTSQPRLINLMKMSVNRQITQVDRLNLAGKEYIVVAMPGRQLNRMILAAFLPLEKVKRQREIIISRAKLLVISLCLLAMATLYLLRSWLFRPLQELRAGIDAIAKRDFHKRLEIVCHNEFGELMTAFNHSLETLHELEVARIVQESLLPENALTSNRCQIVAKTRIMTNLGGDYYDMIPLDDNKVLLFIGDASGHGIPAALSMAMAKSILIHENHLGLAAVKLMQQVNSVFGNLRQHGSKDYMTALCVELDTTTGRGHAINAGHCYPMIFSQSNGRTRTLSELNALPPGFDLKIHYQTSEFMLQPGDRLILFTDGFVECQDSSGHQIGFDGLAEIITTASGQTAERHIANIFQRLEHLSAQLQDDCTMIMLSFQ
jgi:HAMP domain-containing protein